MNSTSKRQAFGVHRVNSLQTKSFKSKIPLKIAQNGDYVKPKLQSIGNLQRNLDFTGKPSGIPVPIVKLPPPISPIHPISSKSAVELGTPSRVESPNKRKVQSAVDIRPSIPDIDKTSELTLMPDYAADIYDYLREFEVHLSIEEGFMKKFNPQMKPVHRSMIIDWIFRFDGMFDIVSDTYCITTYIFDAFISRETVERAEYQLAGLACFYLACKYEEVYYPLLQTLVEVCDNLYDKRDFLEMEKRILGALKFDIGRPSSLQFLRRYSRAALPSNRVYTMAKYFCELSLVYYEFSHLRPSMVAAAALYLSILLNSAANSEIDPNTMWTPALEYYSTYKLIDIESIINLLAHIILDSESSRLSQARDKYSDEYLFEVSKLTLRMEEILQHFADHHTASSK